MIKNTKEKILDLLKSKTILKRKPDLKLCSNHLNNNYIPTGRFWDSRRKGTAHKDGRGWYK